MKKYKVIKPFFKLSEKKNYEIGDTIELSADIAEPLFDEKKIEEIKTKK